MFIKFSQNRLGGVKNQDMGNKILEIRKFFVKKLKSPKKMAGAKMTWKTEKSGARFLNKEAKQKQNPGKRPVKKSPQINDSVKPRISLAYLKVEHFYKTFPKMKWHAGKNQLP